MWQRLTLNFRFKFQTAKPLYSRGAKRPRFANPSRTARGDGAAGGARAPAGTLGGGINVPTSRGKATARAQGRRCASRRSTWPPGRRPFRGAPVRPAFALSAAGPLLESGPSLNRTSHIYRIVGITSIGIFRFPTIIFCRPRGRPRHAHIRRPSCQPNIALILRSGLLAASRRIGHRPPAPLGHPSRRRASARLLWMRAECVCAWRRPSRGRR